MAFDLVTWEPRISGTGNDKYNPPGATKIDGTIDTGLSRSHIIGDASGFSSTPTIPELNASSGFNQVIGLANRRALRHNALFGCTIPQISYIGTDERITAARINAIHAGITAVVTTEGIKGNIGMNSAIAGQRSLGPILARMRKNLAIGDDDASVTTILAPRSYNISGNEPVDWRQYRRTDDPYGSITSESVGNLGGFVEWDEAAGAYIRRRIVFSFRIPEWLTASANGTFQINLNTSDQGSTAVFRLYQMAVGLSGATLSNSDFYTGGSLIYSYALPNGNHGDNTTNLTIPSSDLIAAAGGYISFLGVFHMDFDDSGITYTASRIANLNWQGAAQSFGRGGIVIDLG